MRKLMLLVFAGLAGSAVAILPSLGSAQGTTASFTAVDNGDFFAQPTWSANGTTGTAVTIAPGGTVTFGYPSGTTSYSSSIHNVVFTGAQPTSCTQTAAPYPLSIAAAPPLPHMPEGPAWSGSCRFDAVGVYSFQDGYRGATMSGTVTVVANPSLPTTTTTAPPSTTTAPQPPTTTTFHEPSIPAAASELRAASSQRGRVVRGQINVTAPGSRLIANLYSGRPVVRIGRTTLHGVTDGTRHFTVHLYAGAARALDRRGNPRVTVTLSVQVLLSGALGPTTLSRHVALTP